MDDCDRGMLKGYCVHYLGFIMLMRGLSCKQE